MDLEINQAHDCILTACDNKVRPLHF
jgi:hypothetical protein